MTSSRRIGLVLALSLGFGNLISGCGGDDGDDDTVGGKGGTGAAGKGASAGKGGSSGKGGSGGTPAAGKGGTSGKGGSSGKAGKGGTGGTGATGGTGNVGGEAGTGAVGNEAGAGQTGVGGTAGTGGTGGTDAGGAGAGGEGGQGTSGEGGSGDTGGCPAASRTDLFNFDTDNSGIYGTYLPGSSPATATTAYDSVEGNPAPGSAKLDATLSAFGQQAAITFWLNTVDWTCATKVHAMVKMHSATDLTHISDVNLSISSNGYAYFTGEGNYPATTFANDVWYPIELDFDGPYTYNNDPAAPKLTDVNQVSIMLDTVASGTTPVPTTMYVDDVWFE